MAASAPGYELIGSCQAAFLNGIAWNLVNMSIAFWLLLGASGRTARLLDYQCRETK